MPLRRCRRCLGYHRTGERCPLTRGPNGAWSPGRDRAAQQQLRDELLDRARGRCEWVDEHGRCTETHDLRACHGTPFRDSAAYDASDALLLCKTHDQLTDPHAR